MPGTDVLVRLALVVAAVGALLLVVRWAWNARKREGGSEEKAEALERAVVESGARDARARKERSLSHSEWKKSGKKRRRARPRKPRAG